MIVTGSIVRQINCGCTLFLQNVSIAISIQFTSVLHTYLIDIRLTTALVYIYRRRVYRFVTAVRCYLLSDLLR